MTADKWSIRRKAGKEVFADAHGMHGVPLKTLKSWQSEWQDEHCRECIHFDADANDFKEKEMRAWGEDCVNHWTDIAGACWNWRTADGKHMA